jgi:bacteriocin-like protein
MTKTDKTSKVDLSHAKLDELSDRELDKVTGGVRKAGEDPQGARAVESLKTSAGN